MSDVKPDWSKAPEWANYWAVDASGHAFWYTEKPQRMFSEWRLDGIVQYAGQLVLEKLPHTFNWFDSLHENPKNIVDVTVTLTKPVKEVTIDYKLLENIFGYMSEEFASNPSKPEQPSASSILEAGLGHMKDRAATYDAEGGERSMAKTVECFNALTGRDLTETEGWLMMVCLKLARANQGGFRMDSFEDGAAYIALMGESAALQQED